MFMGGTTPTALSVPNIFSHSVALDVTLFSTHVRIRCAPVGHEPVWCDEEAVRARLPVVKRAVRAHGGVGDVEPDVQGAVPALRETHSSSTGLARVRTEMSFEDQKSQWR